MKRRKMTREEAEARILEKLKEIRDVMKEYYPEDDYLSLTISGNHLFFWNKSYERKGTEGILDMFYYEKEGGENE